MKNEEVGMREKLIGTIIGFGFGIISAFATFNMFVSLNPQDADVEKGGYLLICLLVVSALVFIGFRHGEDPSFCVE